MKGDHFKFIGVFFAIVSLFAGIVLGYQSSNFFVFLGVFIGGLLIMVLFMWMGLVLEKLETLTDVYKPSTIQPASSTSAPSNKSSSSDPATKE